MPNWYNVQIVKDNDIMKKAFTLLELVFVLVVIGILAAVILPRTTSDSAVEAALELQSSIRYTQHLAMQDDKFDANNNTWFRNRWQIRFNGSKYSIVSDNGATFAKDPANTSDELQNVDLAAKYDVSISLGGGCANETIISFDHYGRPIVGDLSNDATAYVNGQLLNSTCTITVSSGGQTPVVLELMKETGYIRML